MLTRLVNFREEREGGFTLVELLVVIIIIGILAAIAIPVFLNQRQRANDAAVQSAVKSYVTAAESYLVANPNATSFGADNAAALTTLQNEGARKNAEVTITIAGNPTDTTAGYRICGSHSNGKEYRTGTGPTAGIYRFQSAGTSGGQYTKVAGAGVAAPVC